MPTLPPSAPPQCDPTSRRRSRWLARCLSPVLMAGFVVPVLVPATARAETAVPETTEARLHRIEGELRALQRKVFPDGAGKTFAPQITPDAIAAPGPVPSGNAAALSDVLSRMDAVEAQLKALTASGEEAQNRLGKLEARVDTIESTQAAAASAAASAVAPAATVAEVVPAPGKPAKAGAKGAPRLSDAQPAPSSPGPSDRAAAVAAIERPSSDDKGEDAYTYGYRLWEAKFLPESEAVLNDFVQQYPKHRRISYARNLLGRAYLDDNRLRSAEQAFLQNYLADKTADRAPDSLLYLAIALIRDKVVKRACDALGEFRQDYPTEAGGRLKGQYDAVIKTVTCH